LRKTNYNFIKIDLNFPATLASPSFELATLGIGSKTLNPTATEAYTSFKLCIYTANVVKNPKSLKLPGSLGQQVPQHDVSVKWTEPGSDSYANYDLCQWISTLKAD
jgi:hypothetical protein